LARVDGRECVKAPLKNLQGEVSLVAIGKAAQAMTQGAVDVLGHRVVDGLVISKPGHLDLDWLESKELKGLLGGHPVPDASSLVAGEELVRYIAALPQDRQLVFLISGGASSLVERLRAGVDLAQLQQINSWLLGSGLPIDAMNRVRKSISRIKGGGLINTLGGRPALVLLISDVPGDDPGVIGSGLLIPQHEAADDLQDLQLPDWLLECLPEPSKPALERGAKLQVNIVASLRMAREAAAEKARELGYAVTIHHAHMAGDVEVVGRRLAYELSDAWPGLYIWGGEPTIKLPEQPGRGGRNQHLALSVAGQIAGNRHVCFLSAGTDGGDGPGEDAGAVVDGATISRGSRASSLDYETCLLNADSGTFLEVSGDLIRTGPTGTNVMDLMLGIKL
jgi:glycerate 2-kinase